MSTFTDMIHEKNGPGSVLAETGIDDEGNPVEFGGRDKTAEDYNLHGTNRPQVPAPCRITRG